MLGILFNPDESAKTAKELGYKFTDANGAYNEVKVYDQANIYVIEKLTVVNSILSVTIYILFQVTRLLHLMEILNKIHIGNNKLKE